MNGTMKPKGGRRCPSGSYKGFMKKEKVGKPSGTKENRESC